MHHHDHDHDHDHGGHGHHHHGGGSERALAAALVLNGGYLVVEAVGGWWTGSLSLLSDAAHMASDVGALALAWFAARLAREAASAARTFGLRRAEVLGAFVNGLTLLLACGWIVVEAVGRLSDGAPELPGLAVMAVAAVGLAVNLGSAWWLARGDHDDLNTRAALAHMLADALGSVAAVAAGGLAALGWPVADPIASLLVAALVAWGSVRLVREAGAVLLQLPPPGLDVAQLREALLALEGIRSVHDLHVWTLDGRSPIVTAHLVVADATVADAVRGRAAEALEHGFRVRHATLQTEHDDGAACDTPRDCGG